MAKSLAKKQVGGVKPLSTDQIEAKRDSLYKIRKAKTDSIFKSMQGDVDRINAIKATSTKPSVKKTGGSVKTKKK